MQLASKYVEQKNEATPADVMLFKHWLDIASKKRNNVLKQRILLFLIYKIFVHYNKRNKILHILIE